MSVIMPESNLLLNEVSLDGEEVMAVQAKSKQIHGRVQTELRRSHELIGEIEDQWKKENDIFSSKIKNLQKQLEDDRCEAEIAELERTFRKEITKVKREIEEKQKQLDAESNRHKSETENHERQFCSRKLDLDGEIMKIRNESLQDDESRVGIDDFRKKSLDEKLRCEAEVAELESQFQAQKQRSDCEIESLCKATKSKLDNLNREIERRQKELADANVTHEAGLAERKDSIPLGKRKVDGMIEIIRKQYPPEIDSVPGEIERLVGRLKELRDGFSLYEADFAQREERILKEETNLSEIEMLERQSLVGNVSFSDGIQEFGESSQDESIRVSGGMEETETPPMAETVRGGMEAETPPREVNAGVGGKVGEAANPGGEENVPIRGEMKAVEQLLSEENVNVSGKVEEAAKPSGEGNVLVGVGMKEAEQRPPEENVDVSGKVKEAAKPLGEENVPAGVGMKEAEQLLPEENVDVSGKVKEAAKPSGEGNVPVGVGMKGAEQLLPEENVDVSGKVEKAANPSGEGNVPVGVGMKEAERPPLEENVDVSGMVEEAAQPSLEVSVDVSGEMEDSFKDQSPEEKAPVRGGVDDRRKQLQVERNGYQTEREKRKREYKTQEADILFKIKSCQQAHANITSKIEELQTQWQDEESSLSAEVAKFEEQSRIIETDIKFAIKELQNLHRQNAATGNEKVKDVQKQLADAWSSCRTDVREREERFLKLEAENNGAIEALEKHLQQVLTARNVAIKKLEETLQAERSRHEADTKNRENQFLNIKANLCDEIKELDEQLQVIRCRYETGLTDREKKFLKALADCRGGIEELRKQLPELLQAELSSFEELNAGLRITVANLRQELVAERNSRDSFQQKNASHEGRIKELLMERGNREERAKYFRSEFSRYEAGIQNLQEMCRRLEEEKMELRRTLANQEQSSQAEIQRLGRQLEVAERRNSYASPGGESFSDAEATPHLLNRAVERVNTASSNFTKLLMMNLKSGGVDCTKVAKALVRNVRFERDAHTKFLYQALVCKTLFTDFESECFNIPENAPESLDPDLSRIDNFRLYKQLMLVENPEEIAFEGAPDNDFRRFCIKKQKDLVSALAVTGAPHVANLESVMFGDVFGPNGIRRQYYAKQPQTKLALSFVKFVLPVFLVHKLSFALHPIARIFRVREAMEVNLEYMEPVVASADSDTDDDALEKVSVGFMVVPGFNVNRIIVHSKVYTVKR